MEISFTALLDEHSMCLTQLHQLLILMVRETGKPALGTWQRPKGHRCPSRSQA